MTTIESADLGIIRIALIAFIARCESEAAQMDEMGKQFGDEKCAANAAASRRMKAQAQTALDRTK